MTSRLGVALLLAACATPSAPLPVAPRPPADEAVELASRLPARAERCVVARPGRVPARRRGLVLRQSWADPSVWENDFAVTAYARAEATLPDGRRAMRSFLRFGGTPAQARERGGALPLRWDDGPCRGIECRRPYGRWIDERTLEVSNHDWPLVPAGLDTERCVRLARARVDAVEVAVRAGPIARSPTATRVERTLHADHRGIEIRTALPFRHEADAERAEEAIEETGAVFDSLQPLESAERSVERVGTRVRILERHHWADLELAREDERIEIAATQRRSERRRPLPVAEVDVESLAVVRHQVRLRSWVLERARGAARLQPARELATLLARARAAHPTELWIADRLARLWLAETGEAAAARALAEQVLASELAPDPEAWRVLRREAIAATGHEALAAAWLHDDVATTPAEARRGAEDVARLSGEGVAYEWAEGAWRIGRDLSVVEPTVVSHGTLSRRGVLGALVALGRVSGTSPGVTVQVAVTTTSPHAPQAFGRSRPELVITRGPHGGSVLVGALGSLDLLEVRRLAEQIDPLVGAGPASFVVWLRDPGTAGLRLRVDGTMRADGFVVRRVSRALRTLDVPEAERLLARPLHDLQASLFPPPELVVRSPSVEDAAALWRELEDQAPGICASAGPLVRCRAPGRPDALTDVVLQLARSRFAGLLQPPP